MNVPAPNRHDDDLDAVQVQAIRRMTYAERFQMVLESGRRIRMLVEAYLRTNHPDWSEAQIQAEVLRRARG